MSAAAAGPRPGAKRGSLDGIRVLDLSTPLAEATGRVLADLGAEVIKVEPPGGCAARFAPPFETAPSAASPRPEPGSGSPETSLFWRAFGLGKRSVVLDLDDAGDRERFLALVDTADILIESDTPGDMEARGLGWEALHARNPMLLFVSVSPFGQTGPYARHPATDLTLSAAGGFLNMTGDGDRPPVPVGLPETAHLGATQAAADVLMALYARNRTGEGQHLDCSIQAAVLWSLMYVTDFAAVGQDVPGFDDTRASRTGSMEVVPGLRLPTIEPCKDGFIVMVLVLGAQGAFGFNAAMTWLAEQGGLDEDLRGIDWTTWIQQMQAGTLSVEDGNRAVEQLLAKFRTMTKAEIQEQAVAQKWLFAPVYLAQDLLADPQLLDREFWIDVAGLKMPGPFARLSETPIDYARPAPQLGQDQALVDALARRPSPPTVAKTAPREQIFEGLKVADFSWIAAGPLITKDLANLGATVLRVETETRVDTLRFLPPWIGPPGTTTGHTAANMNESKLGIEIDFTKPEGLAVAHRMVEWADVVVENFTPGTAERLGLGYEQLRAIKPDLVMLYTCMRGQTGRERKHTGFGIHGAALAGLTGITGWPDRKPSSPWGAYTDFISPRYALAALCAALHHRDRTGQGQVIDVSQIEAAIHHLTPMLLDHQATGRVLDRAGHDSEWGCPHGVYRTAETERFVALEARTPEHWRALRELVPDLASLGGDELDAVDARLARREDIDRVVSAWAAEQKCFETAERLREAGVPAYVPLRAKDYHADPQLVARRFFIELDHGGFGRSTFDGAVTTFSATPARPTRAGPLIGEHTFEVMRDVLGYAEDEISAIAATGALT
ncbi:MAG TPA: CoA transferase [Myxococcota bacterium]|nr:CoA transferase [Myxococcota bacterium]